MVDAQAPGLANIFRSFAKLPFHDENWPSLAIDKLCDLWLLAAANSQLPELDAGLREEVRMLIGCLPKKKGFLEKAGEQDTWQIIGMDAYEEKQIRVQKYWLIGANSGKTAFVLQYLAPGQIRDVSLVPGMEIESALVFYGAGNSPRALLKQTDQSQFISHLAGHTTIDSASEAYATELARNPWQREIPMVLEAMVPVVDEQQCMLVDSEQRVIGLDCAQDSMWKYWLVAEDIPLPWRA